MATQQYSIRAFACLLVSLVYGASCVQAGKLLVIPADGSHWTGMKPLVEELGRRGNQVVVVIPEASLSMGPSKHTTTLTFPVPYDKESLLRDVEKKTGFLMATDVSTVLTRLQVYWTNMEMINNISRPICEGLLYNRKLMQKLQDYDFDAVLTDPFLPAGVIAGAFLNIPAIFMHVYLPCPIDLLATKCPHPASYLPKRFTHYSNHMTFSERTVNFLRSWLEPAACRVLYHYADKVASDVLQKETSILDLASKAAIWLMNTDFTLEFPMPLMPNMIMIGGIQAGRPKHLPRVSDVWSHGAEQEDNV